MTRNFLTHQVHCCVIHGCKYGDKDCPVENKEITQAHNCMDCEDHVGDIAFPKFYRSLMRVAYIGDGLVYCIIVQWNYRYAVSIPLCDFPKSKHELLVPDYRFFAQVNIGCEYIDKLQFKDFELEPNPPLPDWD